MKEIKESNKGRKGSKYEINCSPFNFNGAFNTTSVRLLIGGRLQVEKKGNTDSRRGSCDVQGGTVTSPLDFLDI